MRFFVILLLVCCFGKAVKAQRSFQVGFSHLRIPNKVFDSKNDTYELKLDISPQAYQVYKLDKATVEKMFSLASFSKVADHPKLKLVVSIDIPQVKVSQVTSIENNNGGQKFKYAHEYAIPNGVKLLDVNNQVIFEEHLEYDSFRKYFYTRNIVSAIFESSEQCKRFFSAGGEGHAGIYLNYKVYGKNTLELLAASLKRNLDFGVDMTYEMIQASPFGEKLEYKGYNIAAEQAIGAYSTIKAGKDRSLFIKYAAQPIAFWKQEISSIEAKTSRDEDQDKLFNCSSTNLVNAYLWSDKLDSAALIIDKMKTIKDSYWRPLKDVIDRRRLQLDQLKRLGIDPYKGKGNIDFNQPAKEFH